MRMHPARGGRDCQIAGKHRQIRAAATFGDAAARFFATVWAVQGSKESERERMEAMDATRTKAWQKILLTLLGAVLVFGLSPLGGGYAFAAEGDDNGAAGGGAAPDVDYALTMGAQEDEPPAVATAEVDFTSQMGGEFLHAPQFGVEVASNEAETYGYTDSVDGVSVLDVLVKAHELVYGDDFTADTAQNYLEIGQYGSPNKQFGIGSNLFYGGFFLNHAMANDGTMYDDTHYNGTTVTTQAVIDGDLVEFFFYEDKEAYGDSYNWFVDTEGGVYSRGFIVNAGEDLNLTLMSFFAMESSMFKDAYEMVTSDVAMETSGVQLYMVDLATGATTPIEGAITDADGEVTLNFDEPGEYCITAYETEDAMFKQIMTLTKVEVADEIDVTVSVSKYGELVTGKDGKPVAEIPLTLIGKSSYTIDDALAAVHNQCYEGGAYEGYATAMTEWGLGVTKLWGDVSGNFAYQVDYGNVYVMGLDQAIEDGDAIDAYILQNWYPDTENYAVFDSPDYTVEAGNALTVSLSEWTYDESFNMVKSPLVGASVHVFGDSPEGAPVTDADGKAEITFDKAGTYIVTASKTKRVEGGNTTAITAPVCTVAVTGDIDVKVSVSKYGELVTGKDDKPVAEIPVTLSGKVTYTIDDALKAVHEQCYEGGAAAGYATAMTQWGLSVTKLWGDESGNFGYQLNQGRVNVGGPTQIVENGDTVDAYVLQGDYWTTGTENYAIFSYVASYPTVGQPLVVELSEFTYDDDFNMVKSPLEGAAVHVFGEPVDGAPVTNAEGKAELTFDTAGTYILTATKTRRVEGATLTAITAPVAIITVSPVADDTARKLLIYEADLLTGYVSSFVVSEDGSDVAADQRWINEFSAALLAGFSIAAKDLAANPTVSEKQVSDYKEILKQARTALDDSAHPGKVATAGAKEMLDLRADEFAQYLAGFAVSEDGTDVPTTQKWIDQDQKAMLDFHIAAVKQVAASENATTDVVAEAKKSLIDAKTVLDEVAKPGTKDVAAEIQAAIDAAVKALMESDVSNATISVAKVTYTGEALKPVVTVKLGGKSLTKDTDFTVSYANNVNAGTGIAIVKGKGSYIGSATQTFTIAKAENTLKITAKAKKITVKAGNSLAASKVFKVTKKNSTGKITYKKTSGNKKITVASNGKVTVKQGLKATTYTVKVKATQKATDNYKSKTINKITLKIKVTE